MTKLDIEELRAQARACGFALSPSSPGRPPTNDDAAVAAIRDYWARCLAQHRVGAIRQTDEAKAEAQAQ
jgi:hypothetical protein